MAREDGIADFNFEFALYLHLRSPDLFLPNEAFMGRSFSMEQLFHLGVISLRLFGSVLFDDKQEKILQNAFCRIVPGGRPIL